MGLRQRRPAESQPRETRAKHSGDAGPERSRKTARRGQRHAENNPAMVCIMLIIMMAMAAAWFAAAIVVVFSWKLRVDAPRVDARDIVAVGGKWVRVPHFGKNGAIADRVLEYFECGRESGTVIYMQHGYGQTGQFWVYGEYCKIANELGLKIVSPSMPGFGLSDAYPVGQTRSLREWPRDVYSVLKDAGLSDTQSFYVAGVSAGCVHAASVAAAFSERIAGVALLAPTAPQEHVDRLSIRLARETEFAKLILSYPYLGDFLAFIMGHLLRGAARFVMAPDILQALQKMDGDKRFESLRAHFLNDCDRAANHTYRGWTDNMATILEPVPFELSLLASIANRGKHVLVTSAPDDTTNAPEMQEWFAETIPGSTLISFPRGWGHMHCTVKEHFHRVLKQMVGKGE